MARLEILVYPDPRLRVKAEPVEDFGPDLARFADDLVETLQGTEGIGLSSIQVGDRRAVLVAQHTDYGPEPQLYVNPEILTKRVPGLVQESCLSIPGVEGNVVRSTEIEVRAQNLEGAVFERSLSGMDAVCLQHEVDHLEGRLFIDRLSFVRRWMIRASARRRNRTAT